MSRKLVNVLLAFMLVNVVQAQTAFDGFENLFTAPRHYTVYQTRDMINTDGSLDEPSWQQAQWTEFFTDIEGERKPAPAFKTRCKMLWDDQHLYIAAELEEPNIWATLSLHDQIVFHDNDFELFIDPDCDGHNYFEIEINALKTIFDLFMPRPYRDSGSAVTSWDAEGMMAGVQYDGTLNQPNDTDKKWRIEFSIPFHAFQRDSTNAVPANGTIWRMNFSRVEWDTEIFNGQYQKKKNPSGKNLAEHNWVWSSQGVINMHYPERWGYVFFSRNEVSTTRDTFQLPFKEKMNQYLWLVYYKQHQYFNEHGHYANTLSSLNIPGKSSVENNLITLRLNASPSKFEATVSCSRLKEKWRINEEGKIFKVSE
ncbi:MAG TPA: carbohydrate-binding family 9-like protein [Chitinophagales bacterium]|nr:carbohydrate-binding family 9-like protein [Chitinophagales bacterium]